MKPLNRHFYFSAFVLMLCSFLMGCNPYKAPYEVDSSPAALDTIAMVRGVIADVSDTNGFRIASAEGQTGQVWKKLFKACMTNDILHSPYYFGVSNTQGLGALFSQQGGPVFGTKRLEYLDSVVSPILAGNISQGVSSSCSQSIALDIDFNTLLSASWKNPAISGTLSTAFSQAKEIKSTVKHWHINNLAFDQFIKKLYQTKGSDQNLNNYYDFLNGHFLCTSALYVDTFQTVFILSDTISSALKLQIDSGAISANFGGANGSISFSTSGRDTIIASTNNTFVVFGGLSKVKSKELPNKP